MDLGPQVLLNLVIQAAEERKAFDIAILQVTNLTTVCDYFVLMSGRSTVQVKAIAEHIQDKLTERGIPVLRREGFREGHWVLLDYGDTVVHVFQKEEREFYALERLWRDAPIVKPAVSGLT
ncbi:MAG TPA: ribosome silencing factor [Desulfotomaculum sp.]|nr:ribosome silencing factor [Desulfotomaculum sp.]